MCYVDDATVLDRSARIQPSRPRYCRRAPARWEHVGCRRARHGCSTAASTPLANSPTRTPGWPTCSLSSGRQPGSSRPRWPSDASSCRWTTATGFTLLSLVQVRFLCCFPTTARAPAVTKDPAVPPSIPCMSLRWPARSSMQDAGWSALSQGGSTSQPAMAVALVMRMFRMAHLCGSLHRVGHMEHFCPAPGGDLRRSRERYSWTRSRCGTASRRATGSALSGIGHVLPRCAQGVGPPQ